MYNKINIVESKNPPTNKNDWWYDLNTGVLKRFSGGKYNSVVGEGGNTPTPEDSWIPVPDLYANISSDELLVFHEDGEDTRPDIHLYSDDGYGVVSKEYDYERGAWVIKLSTDITGFTEQQFELYITNNSSHLIVVFPKSLEGIDYYGIHVSCNDEPTTLVFTSDYLGMSSSSIISGDAAFSDSRILSIVTYSHNLIKTDSPIRDDVDEPIWETPIYVQPSLLEEYKSSPFDENYNIQSIE